MRFIVSFLLFFGFYTVGTAYAQFPYSDSFRETTAKGTVIGGSAILTAPSIDQAGSGYLRLTGNAGDQAGFARNRTVFPSTQGISVTFEYFSYGGTGTETADGICFFLFDSDVDNLPADGFYPSSGFAIGGSGGSLGYAVNNGVPGLRSGVIGIGLDEFGNFATNDNNKKQGAIPLSSRKRNNVTIRGDGYGTSLADDNYEYLTHVVTHTTTPTETGFRIEGQVDGRTPGFSTANPGYRKAKFDLIRSSPTTFTINLWITVGGATVTTNQILTNFVYTPTNPIPANLSYGLSASTGGFTNFHEVRNIDIVVPESVIVPPVAVNDTVSTAEDQAVTFNINQNDYDPNGNRKVDLASIDLDPSTPLTIDKNIANSNGTYAVTNQGVLTFTPAANFTGLVPPIKYLFKDSTAAPSNEGSIIITVTPVNDAPVATVPTTISITEDTPKALTGISFTDIDASTSAVIVSLSLPANSGTLSATTGGNVTVATTANGLTLTGSIADINTFISGSKVNYAPVLNSNTDVVLTIIVDDQGNIGSGGAKTNTKTLTLDLVPVNDPPVVSDFAKSGNEDTAMPFATTDFTSKFTDTEGSALTNIKIISLPANGVLKKGDVLVTVGEVINLADIPTLSFTPTLNFNGTDSFNWNAFDGTDYAAANAAVNITILPVNDPPVASNVEKTGLEDAVVSFTSSDFTNKYSDPENNPLAKIKITGLPANGTLRKSGSAIQLNDEVLLAELANITFTPASNFNGSTNFLWSAHDGNSFSVSSAAVNLLISPVNDAPVAVNDAASTESDTPVTFSVVANDTDPDGNNTIDVTTLDIDPASGTQTTFTVAGQGTYLANNNGTVTFSPSPGYQSGVGNATPINYTVKDVSGLVSNSATITVKVVAKSAPVSNPDEATTLEDTSVSFNLITNDTDANGNSTIDAASVDLNPATAGRQNSVVVTGQGTYTVNNAAMLTFVPVANYNSGAGTATSISYTVNDRGGLVSNASTITVTVTPVPDTPVAVADAATTSEDNSITFSLTANDIDPDGNSTIDLTSIDFDPGADTKKVLTVAGEGTYTAGTNGTITFVPIPNYNSGTSTATPISYTIKDITGLVSNAAQIIVTVSSVNDLPTVSNIPKTANQGQTVTFTEADFRTKFSDPEKSSLDRIRVVSLPLTGSLRLYSAPVTAGQEIPAADLAGITFVPSQGWSGVTSFPWNGNDGTAYATVNANVIINIIAVNSPPVLSTVVKSNTGNQPIAFAATDFTSKFSDPDNNSLTKLKIVSLPSSGSLKLFGVDIVPDQEIPVGDISGITYTPAPGGSGSFTFQWNGYDGTAYSASPANVVISVVTANLPPVVSDINKSGTGFSNITFTAADFTSKFSDPDNNALTKIKVINLPANGTLRLNGTNVTANQEIQLIQLSSLTFQPALNWSGTTVFAWNGNDGTAYAVNNANVNISILLPTDPNAKIGLAKRLTSVVDGLNGSYIIKFLFTLVNYGPNAIENISLKDNLAQSFAGTDFIVRSVISFGNLKTSTTFDGKTNTELLLPASRLNGREEAQVELEISVRLISTSGTFNNFAIVEGSSAITGTKIQDRSTNGLKPDPLINGDVSLAETTPIELLPRATFVPNGFTPNNDGIHDYLVIENALNQKVQLEVFNRWGNRVYKASEYKNDWSGRCTEGVFVGQDIPDGTYFYVVMIGDKEKYIGSLTVQR